MLIHNNNTFRNSKVIYHFIAFVILKLSYDNKRWKKGNNLIGPRLVQNFALKRFENF